MAELLQRWSQPEDPKFLRIAVPHAGRITRVLFSPGRIIAATDAASIFVYHPDTGRLLHTLNGHQSGSGVWALEYINDTLVSGSTDKTIRVWDLLSGRCTHVFSGHRSTIRCLEIVKPSSNIYRDPDSQVERKEWWPSRPYLVSGSRDASLRLWALPRPGDESMSYENTKRNPFHKLSINHENGVKDLASRGRIVVSASYDTTVRIWDLVKGTCLGVLTGHTERVQCVAIDPVRPQAYSGSADTCVRVWNIYTGECIRVLRGHTDIVGVLSVVPSYIVSASADESVRVWDPDTGEMIFSKQAGTTAYNDGFGLFSGSAITGDLQLRRMNDGSLIRSFPGPSKGCWSTLFEGPYCICSGAGETSAVLHVWKFPAPDEMDVDHI